MTGKELFLCRWTITNPQNGVDQQVDIICRRLPIDQLLMDMHSVRRAYRELKLTAANFETAIKKYKPSCVTDIHYYENKYLGDSMEEIKVETITKNYIPKCYFWNELLNIEMRKQYMIDLIAKVKRLRESGVEVYPEGPQVFSAFNLTPFHLVRVVILGQDPYHTPGAAHGLAFSCLNDTPPSLQNIFKEIHDDVYEKTGENMHELFDSGNLSMWGRQGVLLLNTALTVSKGEAGSHSGFGWSTFIQAVLEKLNETEKPIVYMLWGKKAHEFEQFIDKEKHLILKAAHPSPFSADKGFFGCKHFSQANKFIMKHYYKKIVWANHSKIYQYD